MAWRRQAAWLVLAVCAGAAQASAEASTEASGDAGAHWGLPAPGSCRPDGGLRGAAADGDASPAVFAPGDSFGIHVLPALRAYLPEAVWEQREKFFFEGMRLVIGACFADYAPPDFYQQATRDFAGQPRLSADGGLERYVAGQPFPADALDPSDPQLGLKWAWNLALRYQGVGFTGPFRISDMRGERGRVDRYEGEIFKIQLAFRSDQRDRDYRADGAKSKYWIAGGIFLEPTATREFAWRQYRDVESLSDADRSDDVHAYVPNWRRVKRISASQVEGLYMPSFSVGLAQASQMGGTGVDASAGVAVPTGTDGITTRRSGFEALEVRPLLYDYRLLGVKDVLAPINAAQPSYPAVADRDFGPWGLSFASDRWDLRRALVLEARTREVRSDDAIARKILYLDLQTLFPLYYESFDRKDERIDVGIFVGRWSGERPDYPRWPDDPKRPIRTLDPVGAAFANVEDRGSWRRESWTFVSTPPDDATLRRWLSVSQLTKRH